MVDRRAPQAEEIHLVHIEQGNGTGQIVSASLRLRGEEAVNSGDAK